MRARMALRLAGVAYEHREILLRNKPKAMLAISPKGTVPVLQLENGDVIDESIDVMRHAFKIKNHELLHETADMKALINENDTTFKKALDQYKYANRYEDEAQVRGSAYVVAMTFLTKLESRLQGGAYLFGDSESIADVAIFPFVRQFSKVDDNKWLKNDLLKLKYWLNMYVESTDFKCIMFKCSLWGEESEPLITNAKIT
tara:strand:- start:63841 stop:64443 length:603 start_codon:yes stop_codon:yes gene_type:complete